MKTLRIILILSIAAFVFSCKSGPKSDGDKAGTENAADSKNDTFRVQTNYYPNQKPKNKIEIKKVKINGEDKWIKDGKQWNYYEQNGNLQSIETYVNNKREGITSYFYGDGKTLYRELPYKNSKKDGIVKKYYDTGNLQSETPYKQDMLGTGSQDYTDTKEKTKLTMPELKVWVDDKRRENGTYTVYAKVVDKFGKTVSRVEFLEGILLQDGGRKYEHPGLKKLTQKNNVGSKIYYESQGFPDFVSISARLTTNKGTAVLLNEVITVN